MHINLLNLVWICIMTRRTKNICDRNPCSNRKSAILISAAILKYFPCRVLWQTPPTDLTPQTSHSLIIILRPWKWKVLTIFCLCYPWWSWEWGQFWCFAIKQDVLLMQPYTFPSTTYHTCSHMHQYCVLSIALPTGHWKSASYQSRVHLYSTFHINNT